MTPSTTPFNLAARLHTFLAAPQATTDLRHYFGLEHPTTSKPFTGSRFEHLAGGGDRPGTADTVTADDLIAVQTLSVQVPIRTALDLLEGRLGNQLTTLLRDIPNDLNIADADPTHLQPDSPADQAWKLLNHQPGIGWVTAGKLLARKRPRLLPVYDRVVRCALGRPASFWLALHTALRADDQALHRKALALRTLTAVPQTVSALRVCDIVVWMHHHADHQEPQCPGPGLKWQDPALHAGPAPHADSDQDGDDAVGADHTL